MIATRALAVIVAGASWFAASAQAQEVQSDVVLVMDTSLSMATGDPQRRALLVTNLLSDLLDGRFAVIRLRSLSGEVPTVRPAVPQQVPCADIPGQMCEAVELAPQAEDDARHNRPGTLVREAPGSASFRAQLDAHLEPKCPNSLFGIAFAEALGLFESHGPPTRDTRRVLVWLFDGETEGGSAPLLANVRALSGQGVATEALLFGPHAPSDLVAQAGLTPHRVAAASDLIPQFTQIFQRLVGAAHTEHGLLARQATFEIKPAVDDAWVVAYGDPTLISADIMGPAGSVRFEARDVAAYRHDTAGAYRAMHLRQPRPGLYRLSASGGGSDVAFAVIQTASIRPFLVTPTQATLGAATSAVVELRGHDSRPLDRAAVPADAQVELIAGGVTTPLNVRPDGTFSGRVTFPAAGTIPVRVHLRSDLLDRTEDASVIVTEDRSAAETPPPPNVSGPSLTLWERVRGLLAALLVALAMFVIGLGFYVPRRWARGLSVTAAPTLPDLELQRPVPIKTWKGTGIGFYRNARAFLHPDFRISGRRSGALLMFSAERTGVEVQSLAGARLFVSTGGLGWQSASAAAIPVGPGDTVRIDQHGPYVRLHVEGQSA